MNQFYNDYEADVAGSYQIYKKERQEEIEEKLRLETEKKQAKLQAEALAKYEAEQAADEAKRLAEEAKTGKPAGKAKAPPPKKGGKYPGVPDLDVPQLEVPTVTDFKSEMENEYIRERPLQEIIDKLMVPQEEEEEEKAEEAAEAEESAVERAASSAAEDKKASAMSNRKQSTSKDPPGKDSKTAIDSRKESQAEIPADQEDGEEEEVKDEPIKFLQNDYMEKAEMSPPKDPFGNDTMHPNLIIENTALYKIVEDSLLKTMSWLLSEKINYGHKVQAEIKDL